MPIGAKVKTKGGSRIKAHMAAQRKRVRAMPKETAVGFAGDRFIVMVALRLEYGDPGTNLPERPVFRIGARDIEAQMMRKLKDLGHAPTYADATRIAIWARDRLRSAYLKFHGPGLSERQRGRKRGTQYADDELVGAEGPRLIGHIHAYVDGEQV